MNLCYLFAGQGSQFANMGQDLYRNEPLYKQIVDSASETLDLNLADHNTFDNPKNTQVAILTMSYAISKLLSKQLPTPKAMMGLSLGEYSALVSSEALSFASGLKLVHDRSMYMDEAGEDHPGSMAAVLKATPDEVTSVCNEIDGVYPANFNTAKQTVIGGTKEGVKAAKKALKAQKKIVIPLKVRVASHTPLMQSASDKLAKRLEKVTFDNPEVPVISNTIVKPFTKDNLKDTLVEQLVNPTHFMDDIKAVDSKDIDAFIEIGPGHTLSKLANKTAKGVPTYHVQDEKSLQEVVSKLGGELNYGRK
ncbi:malonyl CoA-acyl carrier protein transacylase [Philodulcilactobacillus myokoensis]|uniref:Malonyl CoA-acyl carrier protein transacylase n=1 Tax=Philodulcilactobacillus myokoensis TaxID=2929573 RepID=A0A9W6B0P4_9LACO|nr:ACP S-malonyltransferase [Philodulcilactobacillus myokoensis]GLB46473.1 malonyl CoA-acyl carrier protein transacylase [Philodulcilactobacillus myokoensis]